MQDHRQGRITRLFRHEQPTKRNTKHIQWGWIKSHWLRQFDKRIDRSQIWREL